MNTKSIVIRVSLALSVMGPIAGVYLYNENKRKDEIIREKDKDLKEVSLKRNDEIRKLTDDYTSKIETLRENLTTARTQLAEKQDKIDEYTGLFKKAEVQVAELTAMLQQNPNAQDVKQLQADLAEAKGNLARYETAIQTAGERIEALEAQVETLNADLALAKQENENLKSSLTAAETEIDRLTDAMAQQKTSYEGYLKDLETAFAEEIYADHLKDRRRFRADKYDAYVKARDIFVRVQQNANSFALASSIQRLEEKIEEVKP